MYRIRCIIDSTPKPKEITTMSLTELAAKAREIKELTRLIEEAQAELEAAKDAIKAHMGTAEEIVADEYKIRWTTVTSARFDTTAFKKTHTDLYEQYTKPSTTRRFTIA